MAGRGRFRSLEPLRRHRIHPEWQNSVVFCTPLLFHLFELGETVICKLPDMDMMGDKWWEEILPAIEQFRFHELSPSRSGGSRGGPVESLQVANGATLKFM